MPGVLRVVRTDSGILAARNSLLSVLFDDSFFDDSFFDDSE